MACRVLGLALSTSAVAVLAVGLTPPATSHANVKVTITSPGCVRPLPLASFRTAKCKKASTRAASVKFAASAFAQYYTLTVDKFKRGRSLSIGYGSRPVRFRVEGPAGSWSNVNRPPGAPRSAGTLKLNRTGTQMSLSFSRAFDSGIGSFISISGSLSCKYPSRG